MALKTEAVHFNCPNCNALYQLVKAEAGPETDNREITCRARGGPLTGREGRFVLKYFLLRKAARPDPRARRGSQRHIEGASAFLSQRHDSRTNPDVRIAPRCLVGTNSSIELAVHHAYRSSRDQPILSFAGHCSALHKDLNAFLRELP